MFFFPNTAHLKQGSTALKSFLYLEPGVGLNNLLNHWITAIPWDGGEHEPDHEAANMCLNLRLRTLLLGVSHAHSCANIQGLCESKWAEQIVHLSLTKTLGSLGMEVTNHPFRFPCSGHVLFLASPRQNPWTGWRKAWKSCESGPTWRRLPAFAPVSCFSMSSIIIFLCIIRHWHLGKFWGNTNFSWFLYRFFLSQLFFFSRCRLYPTSLRKGRGEIPGSREKKPDADEWRASPGDFAELQVPWQGGPLRVYRGEFNEVSERYCSKWIQYHIISPVVGYGRDINILPSGMHDIQVWVKRKRSGTEVFRLKQLVCSSERVMGRKIGVLTVLTYLTCLSPTPAIPYP